MQEWAALFQLFAEVEGGALCPATMTYACVPALGRAPGLAAEAMEVLGGNGYVEENLTAGIYRHVSRLKDSLHCPDYDDAAGRRLTQAIALAMQGALLLRYAPEDVAEAFCDSRFGDEAAQACATLGTLRPVHHLKGLIARAWPY